MPESSDPIGRILLVTLSNVGDAVMTTPVMEALHASYPRAVLDIVTDPRSSELFAHCPYRGMLVHRDKQLGWRGTLALLRGLRATRYDLVVDLRTDGLAWLLRSRRRLTRRGVRRGYAGKHAVQRHMGVIARVETGTNIPPPRLWLSAAERGFAHQTRATLPGTRWLAFGPGARWEPKRWPASRFGQLAAGLREEFDALVLFGDRNDAGGCREIADHAAMPCLDLSGRTTLLEATALLGQMRVFVGNDSGLGHLAAAAGIPTLTLFGPGDPRRYRPWNPQGRWLQSPTGRLADLPAGEVVRVLRVLLAGEQPPP